MNNIYEPPQISIVDIDYADEQFPGLPNSVHGDTIKDPEFEYDMNDSIWNI